MLNEIKNKIEQSITYYCKNINKFYPLQQISPILSESILNYINRKGKLIRPSLFVISYLGYCKKPAENLYLSSLSFEMLHNFMLIHDDIIDKSDLRRGLPSMHKWFDNHIKDWPKLKFNGSDLAIVAGDVVYCMALNVFLTIKEKDTNKLKALNKFVEAAMFTGSGEFVEMIYSAKNISQIEKEDINKIYDLKTGNYTFCSPLSIGAIMAGAPDSEIKLFQTYGIALGRAFQIRDDILDMFADEKVTGKPALTDLKESKKTFLLWHAYNNASNKQKNEINGILNKDNATTNDLLKIRTIVTQTGSLEFAKKEINILLNKSLSVVNKLKIKTPYKEILSSYPQQILSL